MTFDVVKDIRFFEADNITGFVIAEQTVGKGCEDISNFTDYIIELPPGKYLRFWVLSYVSEIDYHDSMKCHTLFIVWMSSIQK